MSAELALGLADIIILVGAGVGFLSRRIGIFDIPLLILLGIVVGPVSRLALVENLTNIAPVFAALAITIILFEGERRVNLGRTVRSGRNLILAVLGILFCVFIGGIGATYVLSGPVPMGLLFGSIMSGSSPVVFLMLMNMLRDMDSMVGGVYLPAAGSAAKMAASHHRKPGFQDLK